MEICLSTASLWSIWTLFGFGLLFKLVFFVWWHKITISTSLLYLNTLISAVISCIRLQVCISDLQNDCGTFGVTETLFVCWWTALFSCPVWITSPPRWVHQTVSLQTFLYYFKQSESHCGLMESLFIVQLDLLFIQLVAESSLTNHTSCHTEVLLLSLDFKS